MFINRNNNINFSGNLIFQGNYLSKSIKEVISNNKVIKEILNTQKEDLYVQLKHRLATSEELYNQGREYDLYKIIFKLKKHGNTWLQRFVSAITTRSAELSPDYHSEDTTIKWLNNCKYIKNLFVSKGIIKN